MKKYIVLILLGFLLWIPSSQADIDTFVGTESIDTFVGQESIDTAIGVTIAAGESCTLPYTTNIAFWLDGECSTITESAGEISQWDDISGNNNHATQDTPADKPTETTLGGFVSTEWGGGDALSLTSSLAVGDITIIAVVQPDDTASSKSPIAGTSNALQYRITGSTEQQGLSESGVGGFATSTSSVSTSAISIIAAKYDAGTAYKFWLNGSADGAGGHSTTVSVAMDVVGAKTDTGGDAFDGHILAIVVYTEYVSDANVESVIDFFNDRYGVY